MEKDRVDEIDASDQEYERRRQARIQRRRLEKQRQLRRRKLIRLIAMAACLVLVIFLAGSGVYKLASSIGKKPADLTTDVKADTEENDTSAGKQPVMSAADIEKMSGSATALGWQQDEKGKWYRNSDGTFYQNGWSEIDGAQYYFDANGYVTVGWLELDGKDYYFDQDGKYDETKVRPMVALTYDDGPGQYTDKLLDCLEENNAKATFFMLGENAERYPDIVKRIYDSNMELGNHTYDHQILTQISNSKVSEEISKTNDIIKQETGVPADSLRPPGGSYNETVQNLAGMPIVKWSLDTKDWATKSEDKTYQKVMDNVQDGSIVLMHDIHEWSVNASLRIIPELIEKGFKLVTVQELAEAKGITLENGKVYYYFGEGEQQVE